MGTRLYSIHPLAISVFSLIMEGLGTEIFNKFVSGTTMFENLYWKGSKARPTCMEITVSLQGIQHVVCLDH